VRSGLLNGDDLISPVLQKTFDLVELVRRERAIILKAATFATVGAVSTLVDVSVFWTAVLYLGWPIIAANVLSWMFGASSSYVLNSSITFAAESGRRLSWRRYARFVVSTIAGVVCSTTTLLILSYFVPLLVAKLLSLLVSFAIDFSLSHFVVFRARRADL
jgi:putative flippase GtrA